MTVLRMETDSVRSMANQLKQVAENARSQVQAINGFSQSVDWMGPSRDEFVMEVDAIIRQMESQLETGEQLAQRVEAEVTEWEQTAASLGAGTGGHPAGNTGYSGGGSGGGGGGSWGSPVAGIVGSLGFFTWEYNNSRTIGAEAKSDKYMLDGIEVQAYEGYLKGDISFKEAMDFINKDPFEKKVETSIKFYSETDSVGAAAIDGKLATQYGTFEGKAFAVEGEFNRNVEYKEGSFQANAELSGGAYLAKTSYDASVAGVTVAAAGYLGAEASAKGTAFIDTKTGEGGVKGSVDAFVGGKAEGSISGEVAGVEAKATGSVSYGLGATAKVDAGFSQGHIRAEVELGATLGLGVNFGVSLDLDVGKAANTLSDVGKNAADWLFGGW